MGCFEPLEVPPDAAPAPDAGPPPAVVIGTGTLVFEPIEDYDELGLIRGSQGGYHFVLHGRMQNMDPGNELDPLTTPATMFTAWNQSGERISFTTSPVRVPYTDEDGDGWYELPGGRVCVIRNDVAPTLYGAQVRVRLNITDQDGNQAADERWVVVYDACERDPEVCGLPPGP